MLKQTLLGDFVEKQANLLFSYPATYLSFPQDTTEHKQMFLCQLVLLLGLETASQVFVCKLYCLDFAKISVDLRHIYINLLGLNKEWNVKKNTLYFALKINLFSINIYEHKCWKHGNATRGPWAASIFNQHHLTLS